MRITRHRPNKLNYKYIKFDMKKRYLTVAVVLALLAGTTLSSCVGSFALTKRVLSWNNSVGSKFVNELVFFAFWVLPVYEVTSLADLLVINSIEFWSGNNPLTASTKAVDTDHGRYLIDCDGKGYTITYALTGDKTRLNFDDETQTWGVLNAEGEDIPFMTMLDSSHVRMITPDGKFMEVELSDAGLMAYSAKAVPSMLAAR